MSDCKQLIHTMGPITNTNSNSKLMMMVKMKMPACTLEYDIYAILMMTFGHWKMLTTKSINTQPDVCLIRITMWLK